MADETTNVQAPDMSSVMQGTQPDTSALSNIVQSGNQPQMPQFKQSRLGAILSAVAGVKATPDHAPTKADIIGGIADKLASGLQGIPDKGRPGFVTGLGQGARAAQAVDQYQTQVHFQNLAAAQAAAKAAREDQEMHMMDEKNQAEVSHLKSETVKTYTDAFGSPDVVLSNTGNDVANFMKDQTANGGLRHYVIVNTGQQFFAWDVQKATNSTNVLSLINQAGKISGNPAMAAMTSDQWKSLPSEAKAQYMEQMNAVTGVMVPSKNAAEAQAQLATLDRYEKTVSARTDLSDSDKQNALARIQANKALIKDSVSKQNAQKQNEVGAEAKARTQAEGKDVEAMYKTGKNPVTGEPLSIDNAPDEMLVDTRTGKPIPTSMQAALKPTQTEQNRADFARSTIHTLDMIDQLRKEGKLPNGPLTGPVVEKAIEKGLGTERAQEFHNYIALAQSAATGAHVGGRFNVEIMKKMSGLLSMNMNDSQFQGAVESLKNVMQQYVDQGGRFTVAQWKSMPPAERKRMTGTESSGDDATQGTSFK